MLGKIVSGLVNAATAEDVVAAVAKPEMLQRIRATADAQAVPVGTLVAAKVGHLIDHGAEDLWMDLISVMAGSPQPGAAAIERMMAYAFPDPVRVRISSAHR